MKYDQKSKHQLKKWVWFLLKKCFHRFPMSSWKSCFSCLFMYALQTDFDASNARSIFDNATFAIFTTLVLCKQTANWYVHYVQDKNVALEHKVLHSKIVLSLDFLRKWKDIKFVSFEIKTFLVFFKFCCISL